VWYETPARIANVSTNDSSFSVRVWIWALTATMADCVMGVADVTKEIP
jgi:hypothetical protein